jgi:hypothetical protein
MGCNNGLSPNSRLFLSVAVTVFLYASSLSGTGYAAAGEITYEKPPVVSAESLLPQDMLAGDLFSVDEKVPTDGYMAHFTLNSDLGTFDAPGQDLLKIRIEELPAIQHLDSMSKTKEFLSAAGKAAVKPVQSAVNMVTHPVETVKSLPSGLSRFFERVAMGAKSIAGAATDSDKTGGEKVADTASRVGDATITALGFEDSRRQLAKGLGVDPYTTNAVLSQKLTDAAWVAFSGKLGVNAVVSVFVPASMAISATTITNNLIYETPKADLIIRNRKSLIEMGASEKLADVLIKNKWYSLTVQTSLVTGLESLSGVEGRIDIIKLATIADSEEEARFVAASVQILAGLNETEMPLKEVVSRGTVIGIARHGAIIIPAPVDYVSWTPEIARLAARPDLKASLQIVRLTGKMSTAARQGFTSLGWYISDASSPTGETQVTEQRLITANPGQAGTAIK